MTPPMPIAGGRAGDVIQLHRTARALVGPIAVPAILGDPKADECARSKRAAALITAPISARFIPRSDARLRAFSV